MKVISSISKHVIPVIVTITIFTMGMLFNWARFTSDEAIIDSALDEMEQLGHQYRNILVNTLAETENELMDLAEFIANNDIDSEGVVEYFDSQLLVSGFDVLYYVNKEGNGISLTDEHYDFSGNSTFLSAIEGEFSRVQLGESIQSDEYVFSLMAPVEKNGEVSAMLFCELLIDENFEFLLQSDTYEGNVYFVDKDLNIIYSTCGNRVGDSAITENDSAEVGLENFEKARSDIESRQGGGFYYDYFGTDKVMVYYPIDMTEIALAMNATVESISSEVMVAADYFDLIGTIIFWTAIALVLHITFMQFRSNKKMTKVAYYDPLTDLPNVAKLKLDMTEVLKRNKGASHTIIVIDMENFKAINEMFGYDVGDRVLQAVKTLSESFEEASLLTARIGGDKFAMFARAQFFEDMSFFATAVMDHFDLVVPELIDYGGTFRIGRYRIEEGETNFDDIMAKVNLAHVKAKATKGETLCDYDETLKNQVLLEAEITKKMNAALVNKEFRVYLQPKFSVSDDTLVGAEALVRWIESDGNMIFPNEFIPLFERNGFIVELDKYVLENVCIMLRRWIDDGAGEMTVSVNCSRLNLENPYYVDSIVETADKYNVPHSCIEIELTESVTIEKEDTIEQLFVALRQNGFKISIDDFGAGYSSLGMLKNLHVDTLKMDRSFFVGGKNVRRDDMLIDSIVKMSHNLGMYVVAEGIETADQIELLKSMNCDAVQGFYYDRPMPVAEFEKKYSEQLVENSKAGVMRTSLIERVNDIKHASSFVPSGIVVAEIDESFTIVEANDYYFDMIGYTREEIRDHFDNKGINILSNDSKTKVQTHFKKQMQRDPNGHIEYIFKFVIKSGEERTFRLSGKVSISEKSTQRIYVSVMDITEHFKADSDLQSERDFIARISSLTNSAFFDFDSETKLMRFSKNFADRFNTLDTIERFTETGMARQMFPKHMEVLRGDAENIPAEWEGEFYLELEDGTPVWYIYSCKKIYDSIEKKHRVVGKMSKVLGHRLEMDILKVKSETDPSISVYDKSATDRYIHNYLRVSGSHFDKGTLFIIEIDNFDKIEGVFGYDFAKSCLNDVGTILRNMFRSTDIIGRTQSKEFYVFISNDISMEFAERKIVDLHRSLSTTIERDGTSLKLRANVGTSFYPEHGGEFDMLYQKAKYEIECAKGDDKITV